MNITFRKYDIGIFIVITIVIIFQLVKLGQYPGIYLDAINPDYIGIQLLYPQTYETKWQIAWPWLCQTYHGNVGIIITMLSTIITGKVSVLQHHITYGIVAAIAVFLTYCIFTHKRLGISKIWAGAGTLLMISWPSLITIIITQYYMCLFGSVCVLAGTYIFLNWLDDVNKQGGLYLCYFFFGLAFYSYFNFVFLLPSLVVGTVIALKNEGVLSFDNIFTPLLVYLFVCGLYIVGWSQIDIWKSGIAMTVSQKIRLFFLIYALIIVIFIAFHKRLKSRWILLGVYAVVACIWLRKVLPSVMQSTSQLENIVNTTLAEKVTKVITDYSYILTGKNAEYMIFGGEVTIFNNHVLMAFVIVVVATFITDLLCKNHNFKWMTPVAIILIYLFCCVALGTRMQPQHYVPLVFITYIGFGLCIKHFLECIGSINVNIIRNFDNHKNMIFGVLFLCIFLLNLFNEARIINEIRVTGGENKWASEMTELAEEAMANKHNGFKEIYVFKDWGFFTSFNYLTMNDIPYVTVIDENMLSSFYYDGIDIVVCFWSKDDMLDYESVFARISGGKGVVTIKEWVDDNGKIEFYEMKLSQCERKEKDE